MFLTEFFVEGALMMVRRTLEGAVKWALRDLRREEWRSTRVHLLAATSRNQVKSLL